VVQHRSRGGAVRGGFRRGGTRHQRGYFLYRHHRVIYIGVVSREYLRAHMAQHRGRAPSCNELEG